MFFKFVISMIFLVNQICFAQGGRSAEHGTLEVLPFLANNAKTVGNMLNTLQPLISASELQFTREFLSKNGVNENEALPKIVRNGNEIAIGNVKVSVVADGGIKFNGVIFRQQDHESFDQLVQRINTTLAGNEASHAGILGLMMSKAQAKEVTPRLTSVSGKAVAVIGGILAALLIGTAVVLESPAIAVGVLVAVVATSLPAFGIAALASRNDARLFCDGKKMMIKSGKAEAKYDFTNGADQPSAELKDAKGVTTKTTKFDADTTSALTALYKQGCVSKKSTDINLALERIQKPGAKTILSAGGVRGNH